MNPTHQWPPKRYLTAREAAEYIRSTEGSVRQLVHKREIPHLKRGRSLLFDVQKLDYWLAEGSNDPQ